MKVVSYIRVSTDKQRDNTSLEAQEAAIQAYCSANGYEIVATHVEVESAATTKKRPVFNQAVKEACENDGLIAYKLDRVARNTKEALILVEDVLEPANSALIVLDFKIDTTTPVGKMMLTSMAMFATFERDVIRQRTQGGRKAKAEAGGFAYGSPPYGFKSVDKQLVECPEEQTVIERIRRHRKAGKSYRAIAAYLNTAGITAPRKDTQGWNSVTVKKILDRLAG